MPNLARKAARVHRLPLIRGGQGRRAYELESLAIEAAHIIADVAAGYFMISLIWRLLTLPS